MGNIHGSIDLLPMKSILFLNELDLVVQEVSRLTNDEKLVFLIKTNSRQYVLKVNLPPVSFTGKIRSLLYPSFGFKQECSFYKSVKKSGINGNYAEYFGSNKYNLLIGLLPQKNIVLKDLNVNNWQLIGRTLAMFHWESITLKKGLQNLIHYFIYGVQNVGFRVGLPTVKKALGLRASIRFGYELIKCVKTQPKLSRICLSHNDFLLNNFIFSENSEALYIIDFQDITSESRWPFYDLVRLLSHLKGRIDTGMKNEIIKGYLEKVPDEIIESINIHSQVRFCILKGLIHSLQWRLKNDHDSSAIETYLMSILDGEELDEYDRELILNFEKRYGQ